MCARAWWRSTLPYVAGVGVALALAAVVIALSFRTVNSGSGLDTETVAGAAKPPAVKTVIRWVPVEVVREVPVGTEEVERAFELAGELQARLGEWRERYRLPSGDFSSLAAKVEELQGLLQAAVYEMRLLGEAEGGK